MSRRPVAWQPNTLLFVYELVIFNSLTLHMVTQYLIDVELQVPSGRGQLLNDVSRSSLHYY